MQPVTLADRLIREFTEKIGLEAVDAHRAAFTALACRKGWTKARIGRYLGITRARVGQRVDKLEHYAATVKGVPTLRQVVDAWPRRASRGDYDSLVQYKQESWDDIEFARFLIDMVV